MQEVIKLLLSVQNTAPMVAMMVGGIWGIHFINMALGYRLNILGILPRSIFGIPGIVCSPFLHGDFNHLFFNSIPLFVLANFVMLDGVYVFYFVSASIILMSGIGTWLFGRWAIHVGASSLIVGYWSYLMVNAIYGKTTLALVIGAVSFYYFGALFFSIFPSDLRTSWEGHLFGFLSGIATYYLANSPIILIT